MLKRFAAERVKMADLAKEKVEEIFSEIYSRECVARLDDKVDEIHIEQLSAHINLRTLSHLLDSFEKQHNSKILYYAFLIEAVPILETSNVQLADVLERFSAISPDEYVN